MSCECQNNSIALQIKKGESIGFAFTVYENDAPINLTGGTVVFQVRENIIDDGNYIINKLISEASSAETAGQITDPEKGEFEVKVNSSDIENMLTTRPYFLAIYYNVNGVSRCVSAQGDSVGTFNVLNP